MAAFATGVEAEAGGVERGTVSAGVDAEIFFLFEREGEGAGCDGVWG